MGPKGTTVHKRATQDEPQGDRSSPGGGRGGARPRGMGGGGGVRGGRGEASDGEEDNERSERLFGYNPDSGDVWGEYQAVMGDPMLAW